MQVQPYLFFNGNCDEALAFYQQAVGAKVIMKMHYKDSPMPPTEGCTPISGDKVMHARLQIGGSLVFAADSHEAGQNSFQGFSLSLTVAEATQAEKYFNALTAGGTVRMPLGPTFFSPSFGMLVDKYGVCWMVYVAPNPECQPAAKA